MSRDAYLNLRAFVDELVRCGVRQACTSPGSRSTPVVLSLVRDGRLDCTSHLDERCAGFFAVGAAKASGMPAVLACTSGTAAANYAPAVHEAHEARVPLVVLTADRPPELRDVGAGQVIDQVGLYGSAATWSVEIDDAPWSPERERWLRQTACRAVWTALGPRPGVVHLNWSLREPLVLDAPLPPPSGGRPGGAPWVARGARPRDAASGESFAAGTRGVVVAGRDERPGAGAAVAAWAERAGWPVLADPLSGARRGPAAIAHYDALLRDGANPPRPQAVLRCGDLPTSKPLRSWLAGLDDVPQIVVDPESAWQDPFGRATTITALPPEPPRPGASEDWLGMWRAADIAAAAAIAGVLGDTITEPGVAAALVDAPGPVVVASSMPVRDVETFWPVRADPPRVLSNRGANGIDGTVSTAYGVAAATGEPVTLLLGDLAFLHDLGGLLAGARLRLALTIVLVDNGGGGIFHFLPVSGEGDAFVEHVATPHGLDLAGAAALFGLAWEEIDSLASLRGALADPPQTGTRVLRVRTDRDANVALHRDVWAAVTPIRAAD